MDRTRLRLLVLVVVHVAATIALGQIDEQHPAAALFDGLLFSQLGLLAVWLAFSSGTWMWRVGPFLAGTAAITWSFWWSDGRKTIETIFWIVGIVQAELNVALGLVVARYGPPKLRLIQPVRPMLPGTGGQFSLRQLMAAILVVAVVVSLARSVHAYSVTVVVDGELEEEAEAIDRLGQITELFGVILVSWVASWAALGIAGIWLRSSLTVVLAVALSSLDTYCVAPLPYYNDDLYHYWYLALTQWGSQSLFTIASLLVVRAGGYRLVGRKEMATLAVTT